MSIGKRIKELRHSKNWSQAQLAKKLEIHQKQISVYEREVHTPSVEQLIRMAEVFSVSLDYLAFSDRGKEKILLSDLELLEKMKKIERLGNKGKQTIKDVLDTFILKNQFQELAIFKD